MVSVWFQKKRWRRRFSSGAKVSTPAWLQRDYTPCKYSQPLSLRTEAALQSAGAAAHASLSFVRWQQGGRAVWVLSASSDCALRRQHVDVTHTLLMVSEMLWVVDL